MARKKGAAKTSSEVVYIRKCDTYDRSKIEAIVLEGMKALKYSPKGNVFVKPNVVFANKVETFGDGAWTHTAFVGGSLLALSRSESINRIDMGENAAVGFPTRLCYKHSGYRDEIKQVKKDAGCGVGMFCIDEEKRDTRFIGGVVHDTLRVSRKMARADSMVYLPRLKGHCVCNMTGAVKLNIGICSDDERSIRHDFLLNEKIVDLLAVGYPDFIVMDAIDVGIGNEAFPATRNVGLVIMGTNPIAVDLVGARLLGLKIDEVPYLKIAVDRGYTPKSLKDVTIKGDLKSIKEIDACAKKLQPYDDEFYRWQDVNRELERLNSPIRFYSGPYNKNVGAMCETGCIMGLKMFLSGNEKYGGAESFATAKPVVFVIGQYDRTIDAAGEEVFLIGSCAGADIINAKKITRIDKCFTTASDMNLAIGHKLGMPAITRNLPFMLELAGAMNRASLNKLIKGRYFQDIGTFAYRHLLRRL